MVIKNWADGELLTPAVMNELTTSMTMRFANDAAREALLVGDMAPAPGMTVYMLDSGITFTYIMVGGNGYWVPPPETLCFFACQSAPQTLTAGVFAAIINFSVVGRNFGNWFNPANGKFTPQLPGLYEFVGGIGMVSAPAASPSYALRGGLRFNSSGGTLPHNATENRQIVTTNGPAAFNVRKFTFAMNGTTDYVELVAMSPSTSNTVAGAMAPTFGAKYLGQ